MTLTMEHTLIRASAGTGKTFALSNRYLALLCGGVQVDDVLATTFTRKAAAQILDRVLVRLAEGALSDAKCAKLAEEIGVPDLKRAKALALSVSLLKNLDRLQVMTLDSFFAQVAGRFALELGLPAGWKIADELEDAVLRHEAMEEMLISGGNGPIERLLRLMTKGEARRSVAQLIHDTVAELYSLWCESGKEAWYRLPRPKPLTAEELADVIQQLRSAQLPDDNRFRKARDKEVDVAEQEDWDDLVDSGLTAKVISGENKYYGKSIPAQTVAIYQRLIAHARAIQLRRLADQTEATEEMLRRFDEEYRRLKRQKRLARFDDITEAVARGATLTGAGGLAWRLEADVHHLLLDEFQDTSLAQWEAVRPLAQRVCRAGSEGGSLFSVGDVKQAIYGWRGGVAEIFDTLTDEVPGLKGQSLDESYRSSQVIIDTVNLAFRPAMHENHGNLEDLEPAVAAWCKNMPTHTTTLKDLPGYAALLTAPLAAENGEKVEVTTLRYAAETIAALKPKLGDRSIGVLVRRNDTVARMIFELRKLNVDASEEGGNPLTDSAAVGTLLSLLRLADHPGDSVSAYHVAHSPLGTVVGLTDDRDMTAVCALARRTREELLGDGYGATIGRLSAALAPSCDQRELDRLRQLTELASDYDRTATLRTDDFVTVVEETRRQQPATAAVRVMTIHQAKGLEFDAVVLPDLDYRLVGEPATYVAGRPKPGARIDRVCLYRSKEFRPLLPDEFQGLFENSRQQEVDEALSLLYVMLTRAKQALYMIVRPDDPEKQNQKLHKTFAGLLRASLTDQEAKPETVLFESGVAGWWEAPLESRLQPAADPKQPKGCTPTAPLVVRLAPPHGRGRLTASVETPSRLEGGPRQLADNLLRTDGAKAACRGRLLHAWFEQIEWLDEAHASDQLDDASLQGIARQLAVADGSGAWTEIETGLDALIARFRKMIKRPELVEALSRTAYQKFDTRYLPRDIVAELQAGQLDLTLRREARIAAKHEGRLVGGISDRIIIMSRGGKRLAAEVIDFKTDRFDTEDLKALNAKLDFYRPQLTAYREAVAQMYRLDPKRVCSRLLFVEAGVVAEV